MVLHIQPPPPPIALALEHLAADLQEVPGDAIQIPWGDEEMVNAALEAATLQATAQLAQEVVEVQAVGLAPLPPDPAAPFA